jgi:hypothetical protein
MRAYSAVSNNHGALQVRLCRLRAPGSAKDTVEIPVVENPVRNLHLFLKQLFLRSINTLPGSTNV